MDGTDPLTTRQTQQVYWHRRHAQNGSQRPRKSQQQRSQTFDVLPTIVRKEVDIKAKVLMSGCGQYARDYEDNVLTHPPHH
jgi:hypothetical protein